MDQDTFAQLQAQAEANYKSQQRAKPKAQAQQPQKKGRSGIARWLPTALAVGGTLAAAPFTGGASLLGTAALLGGGAALGGGGGEFLAQKLSGEKTDLGKVAKEGAISGATGAIPIGGAAKAARVARVATKAEQAAAKEVSGVTKGYKLGNLAEIQNAGQAPYLTAFEKAHNAGDVKTAQAIAKKYPNDARVQIDNKPGLISRIRTNTAEHGQQMQARSGGYNIGAKVSGRGELRPNESVNIGKTLKAEGIPLGAPSTRSFAVDKKLADYGSQIDGALTQSNRALGKGEAQAIADNYLRQVEKLPGVDDAIRKEAKNYATNFVKQAKDVKGTVGFRRGLDKDEISWVKNPDAATSAKQLAASTLRDTLHSTINTLAPSLKSLNNSYHGLSKAQSYLVKETGRGGKGGLINRVAESGPIQSLESRAGSAMEKVGGMGSAPQTASAVPKGLLAKVRGNFTKGNIAKEAVKQTIGGAALLPATDLALGTDLSNDQQPPQDPNAVDPNTLAPEASIGSPTDMSAMPQDNSGDIQTQLDGAIKQALANGDTKGLDNLLKVADYYSSQEQAAQKAAQTAKGKPLSAEASKVLSNANSGLKSLDQLEGMLSKGGVPKGTLIPGRGLLGGVVGNTAGTASYDSAARNISDVITRLRTGAALTDQEAAFYNSQLPQAFDSPETIQQKLGTFRDLFESVANRTGSPSTDIEALLQGAIQ